MANRGWQEEDLLGPQEDSPLPAVQKGVGEDGPQTGFQHVEEEHFCFVLFYMHCTACSILIPLLGLEPVLPALEALRINH